MSTYTKPLPAVDDRSKPFWDAARNRELRLPRCEACGEISAQFEKWCPRCGGVESQWVKLSGRGTVWSHCVFHKAYFPEFKSDLPYNVVIVQLEEGPRLISNLVDAANDAIRVGMPVQAHFDDVTPDFTLIKFKPV